MAIAPKDPAKWDDLTVRMVSGAAMFVVGAIGVIAGGVWFQMMVVFVGAPIITFGGLFLLFLLAPTMLSLWMTALEGYVANPFGDR